MYGECTAAPPCEYTPSQEEALRGPRLLGF